MAPPLCHTSLTRMKELRKIMKSSTTDIWAWKSIRTQHTHPTHNSKKRINKRTPKYTSASDPYMHILDLHLNLIKIKKQKGPKSPCTYKWHFRRCKLNSVTTLAWVHVSGCMKICICVKNWFEPRHIQDTWWRKHLLPLWSLPCCRCWSYANPHECVLTVLMSTYWAQ